VAAVLVSAGRYPVGMMRWWYAGRVLVAAAAAAVGVVTVGVVAAAVAVGRPAVALAGCGSGGGVAVGSLLELLPVVMEKYGASRRAAIVPRRRRSGGGAGVGEVGGVAGVDSDEDPSLPQGYMDRPWRGQNAVTMTGPPCWISELPR